MKLLRIVCLGAVVLTAGAQARSDEKDAEKAFRDSLTNQLLIARGFSDEREVNYQWTAQGLETHEPTLRTFGAIKVGSVKVKSGRIEIKGTRQTYLGKKKNGATKKGGDAELSIGSPAVLVIDLGGADSAAVLPQLKEALFFGTLEEARAAIPREYGSGLGLGETSVEQGANSARAGARARELCAADPAGFKEPKVLHSVDPDFSEEARAQKISGNVLLMFVVTKNGDVTDLWVERPSGYGLDEQAAKAVRRYQFAPATCGGVPVAAALAIEVNFAIF